MRICEKHWDMLRTAIDERGLSKFVSRDGQAAAEKIKAQMQRQAPEETFDPLLAANISIWSNALEIGGMYLLSGDYCPICESEAHGSHPGDWWINHAADDQLNKAREMGLVPKDQ